MQLPPANADDGQPPPPPPPQATGIFTPSDRPAACVRASGVVALATTFVFLLILIIEGSVGDLAADGVAFYVLTFLMFLACAGSSYYAVKGERSMAAMGVGLISAAQAIVFFAFMIHDAASDSCSEAVLYFISCAPGERPSIPFLVVQYLVPIAGFAVTAYMSWKLFGKLRFAETRKRGVRDFVTVRDDLGNMSTEADDGLG